MFSKVYSCSIIGLDSKLVEIETDIDSGFQKVSIVGLPDISINESKDRIMSALKNSNYYLPRNKITINLAPANLKKIGTHYDLPIAISILLSSGQIEKFDTSKSLFIGELSLDGKIRGVNGILSFAIYAKENKYENIFIPCENVKELCLIKDINIYPLNNLNQLVDHINNKENINKFNEIFSLDNFKDLDNVDEDINSSDFKYIKGQEHAKRALEIAASGGHNVLFYGPPGSGKTMLARAIRTILPRMNEDEIIDVNRVYSVAGLLNNKKPFMINRPFRSPHHSSSMISIVGGGSIPKPGEISLSHRGVLFLDEFPEFSRDVLESLRQPLEDFNITISRANGILDFPAKFMLIASCNPCPCGYFGDSKKECICSQYSIIRYRGKMSGPIVDRIDMHIDVPRINFEKLTDVKNNESSCDIKKRVECAREIQKNRFLNEDILTNSEMKSKHIKEYCKLNEACLVVLKNAANILNLSARGYTRILKLSRTIADLDNSFDIKEIHITEALQYRKRDEDISFNLK